MRKSEQTFNLKQYSDKHNVGFFVLLLAMPVCFKKLSLSILLFISNKKG